MSKNWGREIEVICGNKKMKIPDLDIRFSVSFTTKEEPNECDIKIQNLSDTTINANIITDYPVIVNAGYSGDIGTLLSGYIVGAHTKWSGVNKETSISGFDASAAYLNNWVSKTYVEGIYASEIIDDLLRQTGLTIGQVELNTDMQYTKGKTIMGKLREVLKSVVEVDSQTPLQILNGTVIIRAIGAGQQTGFILNRNTGLIGSPEPIAQKENSTEIQPTHKIKCQLNHRITSMSALYVESKTVTGNFVVLSGKHSGSCTGDFVTEMEAKLL